MLELEQELLDLGRTQLGFELQGERRGDRVDGGSGEEVGGGRGGGEDVGGGALFLPGVQGRLPGVGESLVRRRADQDLLQNICFMRDVNCVTCIKLKLSSARVLFLSWGS